ncbi:MAG: 50S ribosomal protein L6 [Thermodesulfobacteriota bacterium]
MSRIGKQPIAVPAGVEVQLEGEVLRVKGPRGVLEHRIPRNIRVDLQEGAIRILRDNDQRHVRALHGLTRTLVANMVTGVTEGFRKSLEIVGVGYRAEVLDGVLQMSLGYSHPVRYQVPDGITVSVERNVLITVEGIDKQRVGQVAAEIRSFRKPDVYKGKGVRYVGEKVRKKVGKGSGGGK